MVLRLVFLGLLAGVTAAACAPSQTGKRPDGGEPIDGDVEGGMLGDPVVSDEPTARFALGGTHSCWLASDALAYCWGSNALGQLGDGTTTGHEAPSEVLDLVRPVRLGGRGAQNCAVSDNGSVQCWGSNSFEQLGGAASADFRTTAVAVRDLPDAVGVTMGALHGCAIRSAGSVWCWGNNLSGALGRGTAGSPGAPGAVSDLAGVVSIAAGSSFACAATEGGSAHCWGKNTHGQLGDGTPTDRLSPVAVKDLPAAARQVAAGDAHACALVEGGNVYCWGSNEFGQVGSGAASTTDVLTPTAVVGIAGDAVAVAAGAQTTCALRQGGALACWGSNSSKQLGDVPDAVRASAADVPGMAGVRYFGVGKSHICAATELDVFCWGSNAQGQLGEETEAVEVPAPVRVVLPGSLE